MSEQQVSEHPIMDEMRRLGNLAGKTDEGLEIYERFLVENNDRNLDLDVGDEIYFSKASSIGKGVITARYNQRFYRRIRSFSYNIKVIIPPKNIDFLKEGDMTEDYAPYVERVKKV